MDIRFIQMQDLRSTSQNLYAVSGRTIENGALISLIGNGDHRFNAMDIASLAELTWEEAEPLLCLNGLERLKYFSEEPEEIGVMLLGSRYPKAMIEGLPLYFDDFCFPSRIYRKGGNRYYQR